MKTTLLKIVIILALLFSSTRSNAHNIFDDIKNAETNLAQHKYTFVYLYTSYCGGSQMEFDTLYNTLLKNRDRFNFIILTDSLSSQKLSDKVKSLKPDAMVLFDKYFKSRMHSMKDAKQMGAQFVERYNYEDDRALFSSGVFYLEFPNHNLMKLFWNGNVPRVERYLESIPICQ